MTRTIVESAPTDGTILVDPLVEELYPVPDVLASLRCVRHLPQPLLMESCLLREPFGRYSFLVADPVDTVELQQAVPGCEPFAFLRSVARRWTAPTLDGLPPFQGGVAGLMSYELGQALESFNVARRDEFRLPAAVFGLYDRVLAWDHVTDRAWIISLGLPESRSDRRRQRAAERLGELKALIQSSNCDRDLQPNGPTDGAAIGAGAWRPASRLAVEQLVPQFPVEGIPRLTSNFSRTEYLRTIERVIEYIRAGDLFQANLSQRLLHPCVVDPLKLYSRLRRCNPAPFAGYMQHGDWVIASASPERFIRVQDRTIETRPIKGTRQRRIGPEADLFTRDELRESRKDLSENIMIVDLLRNDLSRVCQAGTVHVPRLCSVETYETVQHLVSDVEGQLAVERDIADVFAAVFPGGSITGAPKIRAMEIIAELEPTVRGPYCGSLFYVGLDGRTDSSILIRTLTIRNGWIQCPVGGGIVVQSDPENEYEETMHKAEGMLRAL